MISVVLAQCRGRLPSPPGACTSDGSRAIHSLTVSAIANPAAAWMSTIAPRSINQAACSGSVSSSTPKPPAHQSVFTLIFAPNSSSVSTTGRSSFATTMAWAPKLKRGRSICVRSAGDVASSFRSARRVPRVHRFDEIADLGYRPALDQVGAHLRGVVIEHANRASPELAAHVDVRATLEQHVDHRSIVTAEDDRRRGGLEIGSVDFAAQFGMCREQRPQPRRVAFANRVFEFLH